MASNKFWQVQGRNKKVYVKRYHRRKFHPLAMPVYIPRVCMRVKKVRR